MLFQYASDLHLEQLSGWDEVFNRIIPSAPNLILAGDIAPPHHVFLPPFLKKMSESFERIFLITGNHEQQGAPIAEPPQAIFHGIDAALRKLCEPYPNITFLQNEAFHFPDSNVSVFGGTFWTQVDPDEEQAVQKQMNDCRRIPCLDIPFWNQLHANSVTALGAALDAAPDRKWVVISHHMPRKSLIHPQQRDMPMNSGFACDIALAEDPRICAWVYGHTHKGGQEGIFHCNPQGQPGENSQPQTKVATFAVGDA